jgi:hypothetical protein
MTLKKEVYLAAAEAVSAAQKAIHNFADMNVKPHEITAAYLAKSHALAKIYVVGTPEAIKGLLHFTGGLNPIVAELGLKREKLNIQKSHLDYLQRSYGSASSKRDHYLETMQKYNLDVVQDAARWEAVNRAFDNEQKSCNAFTEEQREKGKTFYLDRMSLVGEASECAIKLGHLALPLLAAVRVDLELPLDIAEIRPLIEENNAIERAVWTEFAADLALQHGCELPTRSEPVQGP